MSPIERTACQMETLVEAASRYGSVMQLLELARVIKEGRPMNEAELALLNSASTASLLAKAARLSEGVDAEES